MNSLEKKLCLIFSRSELYLRIKYELSGDYLLLHALDTHKAESLIRQNNIACIVAHVDGDLQISERRLNHLATLFPRIPMVGIISGNNIKAACRCGNAGIRHVVADTDLRGLNDAVRQTICEKNLGISWNEFGIDVEKCSSLIQKALRILEERYLELKGVQGLSDDLDIVPETLSREFSKYCKVGPKHLLMILKVRHAIHLMGNPGLSIKEIGGLVGFTNTHCLNRCFHRIFNISPSEYRENHPEILNKDIFRVCK